MPTLTISDEIEAPTIVIDEGTMLEIKATIAFILINFDNVSRAMILATESFVYSSVAFYLGGAPSKGFATVRNVLKLPPSVPR